MPSQNLPSQRKQSFLNKDLPPLQKRNKQASDRDIKYQSIMRNLVRRYVTQEQRKAENEGVTEDDVNEIKNDISAFRYTETAESRNLGEESFEVGSLLIPGSSSLKFCGCRAPKSTPSPGRWVSVSSRETKES